jgi:hypothetical protein
MFRKFLAGTAVAALACTGAVMAAGAASASTTTYHVKASTTNGAWQYDTDDPITGANDYSNSPVNTADSSEYISASGAVCMRSTSPSGDAGIVVPLGHLNDLFNASDVYQPPVLVKSGDVETSYNLYIDTSGNDFYFGSASGFPYVDSGGNLQGDNKFSVPFGSSTTSELGGYTDQGTLGGAFVPSDTYTLQAIQTDYQDNSAGAPRNPMVWAWFGVGDTSGVQFGCISSVNGQALSSSQTLTVNDPGTQVTHTGDAASLQIVATDTDASITHYSMSGAPAGLSINASTGLISGILTSTPENIDIVHVVATDSLGFSADTYFAWNVTAAQVPDTLSLKYVCGFGHPRNFGELTVVSGSYTAHVNLVDVLWGGKTVGGGMVTVHPGDPIKVAANNSIAIRAYYEANGSTPPANNAGAFFIFERIPGNGTAGHAC